MPLHRALIKTHHMTSRKKIQSLTKAAKKLHCAVVIKTGRPPGVMIVEAANESDSEAQKAVESWVGVVRRLRYKDYQLLRMESVEKGDLGLEVGHVREFGEMKELGSIWRSVGCGNGGGSTWALQELELEFDGR